MGSTGECVFTPGQAGRGREAGAGSGRSFGGGRARARRPELGTAWPSCPAESLPPRLCQAAADWAPLSHAPTSGPSPPLTLTSGHPTSGPAARPLFCYIPPGFKPSLGRQCARKPPPRTLLESLNGKGARLSRSRSVRLIFGTCVYASVKKKKNMSISCGGEPGGVASSPSKLVRGNVPGFSEVHLLSCAAMSVVILHFSF